MRTILPQTVLGLECQKPKKKWKFKVLSEIIAYFSGCLQVLTPVVGINLDGSVKKPLPKPLIKWLSDRQCSGNIDSDISVCTALFCFGPTSPESIVCVRLFIDSKCVRALRANFTASGHRVLLELLLLLRNRPIASRWMIGRYTPGLGHVFRLPFSGTPSSNAPIFEISVSWKTL